MLVKELKELLKTPEGLTEEEFDDLPVMVCTDGSYFVYPAPEESGYVLFGESCDFDGKPIDDGRGEIPAFVLVVPMEE